MDQGASGKSDIDLFIFKLLQANFADTYIGAIQ